MALINTTNGVEEIPLHHSLFSNVFLSLGDVRDINTRGEDFLT